MVVGPLFMSESTEETRLRAPGAVSWAPLPQAPPTPLRSESRIRGRPLRCRVRLSPMSSGAAAPRGAVLVMEDVTEEARAEDLDRYLGRIVGRSLNAVYFLDPATLRFVLVNRGAEAELGYSLTQLRGMSLTDLLVDVAPGALRALDRPRLGGLRRRLLERSGAGYVSGFSLELTGSERTVGIDVLDMQGQAHLGAVGAVAVPDLEVRAERVDGGGAELLGDEHDGATLADVGVVQVDVGAVLGADGERGHGDSPVLRVFRDAFVSWRRGRETAACPMWHPLGALESGARRGGRAVECTGLENRQGCEPFESSNLSASAILKKPLT